MSCSRVFACSARRCRLFALATPRAASGTAAAVRARARSRSCIAAAPLPHAAAGTSTAVCARAHAHAPAASFFAQQGWGRWSDLHRAGVAGVVARPQEQYRCWVSQRCSTHAASFLFRTSVPLWPALFSLPSAEHLAAPARTRARAAHAPTTDDERCDVRSAGVADLRLRRHLRLVLRSRLPPLNLNMSAPLRAIL